MYMGNRALKRWIASLALRIFWLEGDYYGKPKNDKSII